MQNTFQVQVYFQHKNILKTRISGHLEIYHSLLYSTHFLRHVLRIHLFYQNNIFKLTMFLFNINFATHYSCVSLRGFLYKMVTQMSLCCLVNLSSKLNLVVFSVNVAITCFKSLFSYHSQDPPYCFHITSYIILGRIWL